MSDNRISVVHEVQPGDGLTVCCGRSLFELPMTDRATNDSRQRTCHSADQSPPSSRVDLSSLAGGGDPSSGVVELPEDEVEAVAQAAVAAVRAGGGSGEAAVAMVPELQLLAARVRAEAAETVAGMCHWVQDVGGVRARESHEAFHFGYSCPYEAAAVMLRGEPDPRRATVSDSGFLARVRAEAVAAERQRIAAEIEAAMPPSARYMPRDTYNGMCDAYRHAVSIVLAAGSVPVATPEPTECASLVSSYHDDEDVSRCGGPANAEWFSTAGEWQPICARHSEGVPAGRLRSLPAGPVEQPSAAPESWGDLAADVMGLVDQSLDGEAQVPTEQRAVELACDLCRLMPPRHTPGCLRGDGEPAR